MTTENETQATEEQDLEAIVYIYADEKNRKAWDLNGFEIDLNDKVLAQIQNSIKSDNFSGEYSNGITFLDKDIHAVCMKTESDRALEISNEIAREVNQKDSSNYEIRLVNLSDNDISGKFLGEFTAAKKPELYFVGVPKTLGIIPLGIGSGFSKVHGNTCFILDADKPYFIDFPEDLRKLGNLEEQINDVILTHNDPDHVGDIRKFIQKKCFQYKKVLNIYSTERIYEDFMESLRSLQEDLGKYVNFVKLDVTKPYKTKGNMKIKVRANIHGKIPTIGLKFYYKGKALGYSSDCNASREFLEKWHQKNFVELKKDMEDDTEVIRYNYSDTTKYVPLFKILRDAGYNIGECLPDPALKRPDMWAKFFWAGSDLAKKARPEWFSDCNPIIHEATHELTDNPDKQVHTYIEELEKLPLEIKEKMLLVHIPNGFESKRYHDLAPISSDETGGPDAVRLIYNDVHASKILNPEKYKAYMNRIIPMVPNMKYLVY